MGPAPDPVFSVSGCHTQYVRLEDVLSGSGPHWARLQSRSVGHGPSRLLLCTTRILSRRVRLRLRPSLAWLLSPGAGASPTQLRAPAPSDSETSCPAPALVGLGSDPGPSGMELAGCCLIGDSTSGSSSGPVWLGSSVDSSSGPGQKHGTGSA
jgi:hypothetical protein